MPEHLFDLKQPNVHKLKYICYSLYPAMLTVQINNLLKRIKENMMGLILLN